MTPHRSTPHRSTPPPTRAELQALLDRERSAWRQRDGETWESFVRRKAPPEPSFFKIAERATYQVALAEALRVGEQRVTRRALFLPLWVGNNEDEEPSSDVWRRHLLVLSLGGEDGAAVAPAGAAVAPAGASLLEVEHEEGPPFWARVELTVTAGAFVLPSRAHAPDIPLKRIGPYAICPSVVRTVIEVVEACSLGAATPAPTRVIPAFSCLAEPAIAPAELPADIADALASIIGRMQLDADEEGS